MTEILIKMMNEERRPITIRELLEAFRKANYIEKWEILNEKGTEYKITL